jgi:hypothetical protein
MSSVPFGLKLLGFVGLVILGVYLLLGSVQFAPYQLHGWAYYAAAVFPAVAIWLAHLVARESLKKADTQMFLSWFFISLGVKSLLSLMFIIALVLLVPELHRILFVAIFFFVYLSLTVFEVLDLLTNLRRNSKKADSDSPQA